MTKTTVAGAILVGGIGVDALNLESFQSAVAERVATCNGTVLDRVVDHFAEREAERRIPLILAGMTAEEEARKQLGKIKVEKAYDSSGNVVSEYFTAASHQQKEQLTAKLNKLQSALGKAITDADYAELEKLVGKGANQSAKPEAESAE